MIPRGEEYTAWSNEEVFFLCLKTLLRILTFKSHVKKITKPWSVIIAFVKKYINSLYC